MYIYTVNYLSWISEKLGKGISHRKMFVTKGWWFWGVVNLCLNRFHILHPCKFVRHRWLCNPILIFHLNNLNVSLSLTLYNFLSNMMECLLSFMNLKIQNTFFLGCVSDIYFEAWDDIDFQFDIMIGFHNY